MGLMMIAASKGTYIEINTYGNEAEKLAKALTDLVNTCFGEGC